MGRQHKVAPLLLPSSTIQLIHFKCIPNKWINKFMNSLGNPYAHTSICMTFCPIVIVKPLCVFLYIYIYFLNRAPLQASVRKYSTMPLSIFNIWHLPFITRLNRIHPLTANLRDFIFFFRSTNEKSCNCYRFFFLIGKYSSFQLWNIIASFLNRNWLKWHQKKPETHTLLLLLLLCSLFNG